MCWGLAWCGLDWVLNWGGGTGLVWWRPVVRGSSAVRRCVLRGRRRCPVIGCCRSPTADRVWPAARCLPVSGGRPSVTEDRAAIGRSSVLYPPPPVVGGETVSEINRHHAAPGHAGTRSPVRQRGRDPYDPSPSEGTLPVRSQSVRGRDPYDPSPSERPPPYDRH